MNITNMTYNSKKKYVLIDDDSTYQSIMLKCAQNLGMELDCYGSLMELGRIGLLGQYDGAIIDYDLDGMNGIEIAEYLAAFFGDLPTVLVSNIERQNNVNKWPTSIKSFVQKSNGYTHILEEVQQIARKKILLFDDDRTYCKLMSQVGKKININVITCSTIDEFRLHALEQNFDTALIDFNLENYTAPEVTHLIQNKPIYLISNQSKIGEDNSLWGDSIAQFFPKNMSMIELLRKVTSNSTFNER